MSNPVQMAVNEDYLRKLHRQLRELCRGSSVNIGNQSHEEIVMEAYSRMLLDADRVTREFECLMLSMNSRRIQEWGFVPLDEVEDEDPEA